MFPKRTEQRKTRACCLRLQALGCFPLDPPMRHSFGPLALCPSVPALWLAAWLLAVLPSPAAAQGFSGGESAVTNPQEQNTLTGTVVNAVNGEPVRRALVQIYMGTQPATITDSEGRFEFDHLPTGQTIVNVHKPGFFSEPELSQNALSPNLVEIGAETKPLILKLIPEGVLFGHVESKDGPVENIPVKVMAWRVVEGRRQWEQRAMAMTDEDGAFRIANLLPGVYFLSAGPFAAGRFGRLPRSRQAPVLGYDEVFYAGAPGKEGATPVEVGPGQRVQVDFSLKSSRWFRVSGVVAGARPGSGIYFQFLDQAGEVKPFGAQWDPGTSRFEAQVPEGSYVLIARMSVSDTTNLAADLPVNVTSDTTSLRLVLSPMASIPVTVRKEAVAPPDSRPQIVTGGPGMPVNVRLRATGSPLPDSGGSFGYQGNDPKSGLAVRNVPPGKYSVEISSIVPWYVYSAQCGSVDLLHEELAVTAGSQPPPIEIVLRDDSATLQAEVMSGGQPAQAIVLVVPGRSLEEPKPVAGRGSAPQIAGLAPGEYNVLALDRDGVEYMNPDVLSRYMSRAQHVLLQPNQNLEMPLDLIPVEK
jgi:hypothetical protein